MKFKQAVIEALKEFGRVMLAAAIVGLPIVTKQLETTGTVDWKIVGIASAVAALKAVDKLLHKWDGVKISGISPF